MLKITYWEFSLIESFNLLKKSWGIALPFDERVVQTTKNALAVHWINSSGGQLQVGITDFMDGPVSSHGLQMSPAILVLSTGP